MISTKCYSTLYDQNRSFEPFAIIKILDSSFVCDIFLYSLLSYKLLDCLPCENRNNILHFKTKRYSIKILDRCGHVWNSIHMLKNRLFNCAKPSKVSLPVIIRIELLSFTNLLHFRIKSQWFGTKF